MKCSYCGEKIPFLKRLKAGGKYCTEEHREKHAKILEREGLARLLEKPALSKFVEFAETGEPQIASEVSGEMAFRSALRLERKQRPAPILIEEDSQEQHCHVPGMAPARAIQVETARLESEAFPALDRLAWWLPLPRSWKQKGDHCGGPSVAMARPVAGFPAAIAQRQLPREAEPGGRFALHLAFRIGGAAAPMVRPRLRMPEAVHPAIGPTGCETAVQAVCGSPLTKGCRPMLPAAAALACAPRLVRATAAAPVAPDWAPAYGGLRQMDVASRWSPGLICRPAPGLSSAFTPTPHAADFAPPSMPHAECASGQPSHVLALASSIWSFEVQFRLAVFDGRPEWNLQLASPDHVQKEERLSQTANTVAQVFPIAEFEHLDATTWILDEAVPSYGPAIDQPAAARTAMDPPWQPAALAPGRTFRVPAPQEPSPLELASHAASEAAPLAPPEPAVAGPAEPMPLAPSLLMTPLDVAPAGPLLRSAGSPELFSLRPALPPDAGNAMLRTHGEMLIAEAAPRPEPAADPAPARTAGHARKLPKASLSSWIPRFHFAAIWSRFADLWAGAPLLARGMAVVAPLLVPTLMYAPSGSQGPSSVRLALERTMKARAMVDLEDDFRSGLSYWEGQAQWFNTWTYDKSSFVVPGQLAFYRPTMDLKDYRMEFLGQIEKKSLGFVFRAKDSANFHVVRIRVTTAKDHTTTATVSRSAMIDGVEQSQNELPLPIQIQPDSMYKVQVYVAGDDFTVAVNGQVVDTWTDYRHKSGGVGFFNEKGAVSRLRWVRVIHQDDFLGKLCSQLSAKTADRRGSGEQPGVPQPGENHD